MLSYLSTLLLRVDLLAESFTVDTIGGVIIAANIPMTVYLWYDTYIHVTMRDERIIHAPREAQVDEPAEEPKAINDDNNVIGSSAFEVAQTEQWQRPIVEDRNVGSHVCY